MSSRGKLFAIEGIDGSGKRTQLELLFRALASRGLAVAIISFPRYESFFGRMVGEFLDGGFGPLDRVDPHFSALLYAGDRLEAKPQLEAALAAGKTILADRYIGSNLAHQSARVPAEKRTEFIGWLKKLEYGIYGLPAEDAVIYLRVPPMEAQELIARKGAREYTDRRRDLQEESLAHLEAAAGIYDALAREPGWTIVQCFDAARKKLRAPEEIHREVLRAVEGRLALTSGAD